MAQRILQESPETFMIYANHECSFHDWQEEFTKLGIKVLKYIHYEPCVAITLPEHIGLLSFINRNSINKNANDYCGHFVYLKEKLGKINEGHRLTQAFFDMTSYDNQVIVLACFESTEGNSNPVCFVPNDKIFVLPSQIYKVAQGNNSGTGVESHEFIKA